MTSKPETHVHGGGKRSGKNPWVRWGVLAACLALVTFGGSRLTLTDPAPTATQPPAPDSAASQPAPTVNGLPLLTVPEDGGSYGFEGYMCYDISELAHPNMWDEDVDWKTLPVYQNPVTYDHAGKAVGGVDWVAMERRLLDTAVRMGLDPKELTITDNAPDEAARERMRNKYAAAGEMVPVGAFDPTELRIEREDLTLSVDGSGMMEVEWTPALTLPEELQFENYSTAEELEAVAAWLLEEYRDLIGMEHPAAVLFGGDRDIRGGVDTETLMDAQPGEASQIEGQNVVPPVIPQRPTQHLVELHIAPGAIHATEAPLLQLHAQFIIGGQLVLGIAHLIMEEADGC